MDFALFVCKVTAELKMRGMTQRELATLAGYSYQSIRTFMALGVQSRRRSKKVAAAISKALGIEL